MNPDTSRSEDPKAPIDVPVWAAMREPPGRLGDIVRRLKQMEPRPSRTGGAVAQAVETRSK
ncbi:MAG: hypothetical protein ABI191_03210 [Rhizomicrobium sp.]